MGSNSRPRPSEPEEIPEGSAVFPVVPEELGIDPLLLAVLHATVFLSGSDDEVVHPLAAEEILDQIGQCLGRLEGDRLQRVQEDLASLAAYARQEGCPAELTGLFRSFLEEFDVEEQGDE
jgi:hypothetical protein